MAGGTGAVPPSVPRMKKPVEAPSFSSRLMVNSGGVGVCPQMTVGVGVPPSSSGKSPGVTVVASAKLRSMLGSTVSRSVTLTLT